MADAAALLFVRSADDVNAAVRAVNALLAARRSSGASRVHVVGLWIEGDVATAEARASAAAVANEYALPESVSLSGVWALWSLDVDAFAGRRVGDGERRRLVLDAMLTHAPTTTNATTSNAPTNERRARPVFVPALTEAEARRDVGAALRALAARHPQVEIAKGCFVHHEEQGLARLGPRAVGLRTDGP